MKLNLLFTKDALQYQVVKNRTVAEEQRFYTDEDASENPVSAKLDELLSAKNFTEIAVVSALNHFTLMPAGFSQHELGFHLIGFNAPANPDAEELMLSINRKYGVQFYYSFPLDFYKKIKACNVPTNFNFSGEKFLSAISAKGGKEIHINLYHNQCEFLALDGKKVVLYNNLDVNSEVDFLYFIMFTLNKIGFGLSETQFFVYGETTENETFLSELRKFVTNIKIIFDNIPGKSFIWS